MKENCHNSRTGDGIDMKLGPVTKRDQRNKTTLKKFDDGVMSTNCDIIVIFFRFMINLEQPGSRTPGALSVKRMFSLIVTFYLTKTENRRKRSHTIALTKDTTFAKKH